MSLLFFIYLGVRRAVAAAYFRKGSPNAVQTAIRWDPANPEYYDALGTLMHLYADRGNSDEIVLLYQNAIRLSPHDAHFWADLGAGYDWAGRSNDALDAFSALDASFQIHRRSTGGWPIFMFEPARFRRRFAPYKWFFRKTAPPEGGFSRSQRTRRATETHFWKCFRLSLPFSLTT